MKIQTNFNEFCLKIKNYYEKIIDDIDKNLKYVYMSENEKKFYEYFDENKGNRETFNGKILSNMK